MGKKSRLGQSHSKPRYSFIDFIRGLAVLLMIIFHFSFDLDAFHYVTIDFQRDWFWWSFPRFIVFLFLLAMGLSMQLVHQSQFKWSHVAKRFFKIGFFAALISLFTFYAFPHNWIYFGTLHCIAACSLLALPFVNRPHLSLLTAAFFLIPTLFGFAWPFWKMNHASMDYIPLFPWLGVVLLGIAGAYHNGHKTKVPSFPGQDLLFWFGRNSLKIYLLHQPILYGLVYGFSKLLKT